MRRAILFLPLMLAACADPVVMPPAGERERALDCTQLAQEIASAEQYRKEARKEDRADWRYLGVVNGYVSWYRMAKAEGAAENRKAELQAIAKLKHCPGADAYAVETRTEPKVTAPASTAPAK